MHNPSTPHSGQRSCSRSVFGLLFFLFALWLAACVTEATPAHAPPTETVIPTAIPEPTEIPCIPSGDQTSVQAALDGAGAAAVLCPGALFELSNTVYFSAADQQIYTQGYPTDDTRALLRVVGENIVTAVDSGNHARVRLSHVIIDGNRPELGSGWVGSGWGALIEWSSTGGGHSVEWVHAYEPRGWSVLYMGEGDDAACHGAIARHNELGPAGDHVSGMADGISLACRESTVEYNTVVDATDGGIVIFQATGSLIAHNTIRTEGRIMFYGISMEDYGPFDGDFSGTRVIANTIDAHGSLIRRGISMGPHVGCIPPEEAVLRSRGALVSDNVLMGEHMAYGFVVSGVEDWTVTGNIDRTTHMVPQVPMDCFGEPVDAPGGFQYNAATSSGVFQEEFVDSVLTFTNQWWPADRLVDQDCLEDLVGADLLANLREGGSRPVWQVLESTPEAPFLSRCISLWPSVPPPDPPVHVMIGVSACEPYCAEVAMMNLSRDIDLDTASFEFVVEGFRVSCTGLPAAIRPDEEVSCQISEFISDGFQVISWQGINAAREGWGYLYPAED